ncbi:AarF/ABC1/UbiB kinase family protein [Candidatus Woesearchaeota archaeon]|nr:AarF/ABC1/UbiB kinase family protein [Candidatus Woesearchaeota archaeon]
MRSLKKDVKDIKRLNQIILILANQGFGSFLKRISLKRIFRKKDLIDKGKPERLRETLEKLGPTFIKLGQILSLRPDLIPKEYVKELSKLQDMVPPFPYEEAKSLVEKELKGPLSSMFKSFSKKPIASASISQVHKAVLADGRVAAVKVQRPDVRDTMERDIEIMFYLARLLEKHSRKIAAYHPVRIIQEFKEWTEKELDFRIEEKNAKRFYRNFRGSKTIKIPKVFSEYCTSRVLASEFIDGVELNNISSIKGRKGYDIRKIMKNGFDSMLTQVFVHGFFHADPHPGNILILKGNRIDFVDFGIVGYFKGDLKKRSVNIFYGIVENDAGAIADTFLEMGMADESEIDIDSFRDSIRKVIEPLQKSRLKDIKVSYVLEEVLDIALKHHVRLPLDFILFGKSLVEMEGVALEYYPDFRLIESSKPFIERLIKKKISLSAMAGNIKGGFVKYSRLVKQLPDQLSSALKKIQKGTFKIDIEDTDINTLAVDIDKSSNRLTYGILTAALLITGALMITIGKPVLYDIPWVSLLCFSAALIFSLMLFVSMKKEK